MEKRQELLNVLKSARLHPHSSAFIPEAGLWERGAVHPGQSASSSQGQHAGETHVKPHTLPVLAKVKPERSVGQSPVLSYLFTR